MKTKNKKVKKVKRGWRVKTNKVIIEKFYGGIGIRFF